MRFAKYRRNADGRFTERNLNVLKFLLSKETKLEGLLRMAGRKARHIKA